MTQTVVPPSLVSIVVPCFNEEQVLPLTMSRLSHALDSMQDLDVRWEIILVDDGSSDQTREIIRSHCAARLSVRGLILSRNFGHQRAVTAGVDAAMGAAVVLIDADLQDPPEVIRRFVEEWRQGADVVYGVRQLRSGETGFKRASATTFYRLLNRLSEVPIPMDTGDFRLMSRRVVDALRSMPEHDRFIRGMVAWVGFRQVAVPYNREARAAGVTKYPLLKMMSFALDGITSFTTIPLRLAVWAGALASVIAVLGVLYAVYARLFLSSWVPGWAALFVAVAFFSGVQLIALGLIGDYLGRIFIATKARPLYIVAENFGSATPIRGVVPVSSSADPDFVDSCGVSSSGADVA